MPADQGDAPRPRVKRRVLIGLTLVALIAVSIGVGVIVADWPNWFGP
jgi:hypothetical protein